SIMVPMRDGVELSTDLYFPEGAGDKLPVILLRTPYDKNNYWRRERGAPYIFAKHGYAVAVQDKRGKYESFKGQYAMYNGDGLDGYDTVDWLAEQSWSSGKIGTYGCSYLGDVQILQSRHRNPHLTAMVPQHSGGSYGAIDGRIRYGGLFSGGAFELGFGFGWFWGSGNKVYYGPPDGMDASEWFASPQAELFEQEATLPEIDHEEAWNTLPIVDMIRDQAGPLTDWEDLLEADLVGPYWEGFSYLEDDDRFDVPALFVNSWYDYGARDLFHQFNLLRRNATSARGRDNQFIITSPSTHCGSESATERTIIGERDMGDARKNFWRIYLDWFDHWLKGVDNGVTEMAKVQYYMMGANEWREAAEWPLGNTEFRRYYLHSGGDANGRYGSGALSITPPDEEPADGFTYDPGTPVPSRGGQWCCLGTRQIAAGSFDQSEIEMRHDVLVYTSPVLEEGVEVTGPIEAVLYVSSSTKDTDFTAKLVDVSPDGRAYNIQEGIMRARYRAGYDKKVSMSPDQVVELRIDMFATSNYFAPGHRIRLEVSSSNFPRFDRNLNTGGRNYDESEWVVAQQTVHHSAEYPSHIILPVIPQRD
ncbi:MAG TPA: CocE/NonD family hydrolase, partial [Acidobacteriota bacterium]|nr:CocE/NonD family hydrolase [Acidobacteriota bacterium]